MVKSMFETIFSYIGFNNVNDSENKKLIPENTENTENTEIRFLASDDLFARSRKIWQALGFANDRLNMVPALAGLLAVYRDLDAENLPTNTKSDKLYSGPPGYAKTELSTITEHAGDHRVKAGKLQQLYNDPAGGDRMFWLNVPEVDSNALDVI